MIQDIEPKKYHCEYQNVQIKPTSVVLCFWENQVLICPQNEARLPLFKELEACENDKFQYLYAIDEVAYFLAPLGKQFQLEGFVYESIRAIREYAPRAVCLAVSTGYQLYVWYRDNRHCGRCGKLLQPGHKERILVCEACGNIIYPKIAPAVIVAVTNGDKLLVTKYSGREYKRYALIAGFCEIGETVEDTVHREVMEEAGVRIKNLRYYKSQPWGFDSNLLLGYFAELDGSDVITMDETELAEAKWVPRAELKDVDDGISLTREMMMRSFLDS